MIGVAIATTQHTAVAPGDALHDSRAGLDVEATTRADGDATNVLARFLAARHGGTHDVARLEAVHLLLAHHIATREAVAREPCPLVAAASHAADAEHRDVPAGQGLNVPDTRGVQAVLLGHAQLCPIELGSAAASQL